MNNIEDLLFRFKEHLKVLNRSVSTVSSYIDNVKSFLKAIECNDIKAVNRSMMEPYIAGIYDHRTEAGKPYKTNTICLKVRSLKRFFEFLEKSNIIFIDPTESIKEPKKEKGLIKDILAPKEARHLLDQPNLGTLMGIRDRAILEMFYSTGIRLDELTNLTIYDADLQGKMLRINKGKGGKDRVVPMGKHAVRFLREYITKVRPHFTRKNRSNRNLFVDIHGKPMSKQAVSVMIRKYTKVSGIKKKITPHTFRHSFATSLIKNGADIRAVQKMLGHANLSTTEVYIRSLGLDVKKVHEKTHPREKDKESITSIKPAIERMLPQDE